MIRSFYFLLFIFMMTACKQSIPENILPPAKMQAVKWDMMQADEMVEYNKNLDTSYATDKNRIAYYQQILQVHNITKDQFQKSLQYYENNPELLKKVLDSMRKQGERLQQKINDTASNNKDTATIKKTVLDTIVPFKKRKINN